MFEHKDNKEIGKYLSTLIVQNYDSQRAFGRAYLKLRDKQEPAEDEVTNLANRLSQIIKGNKSVQTYDLPYFSKLLGISCEQILSAGACCTPTNLRLTNYSIACSKEPEEWEAYINHRDRPILNCDEYCKTVIDYAIEFGNYEFIKYLIDKRYIWFDDGKDNPLFPHLSAGTSIESRPKHGIDYGLTYALNEEITLRNKLIILAIDHNDVETLEYLHAKTDAELYLSLSVSGYLSNYPYDFDKHYGEAMLKHIATSNEYTLDYFTDPFIIECHNSGRVWSHTFLFPPISTLLDLLIMQNSKFTETALKKALKHNRETYNRLLQLLRLAKNDKCYKEEYAKNLWKEPCKRGIKFDKTSGAVSFFTTGICTPPNSTEGIISNIVHISKLPDSPILKHLAEEINELYDKIRNIGDHLEEI